MIDDHLIQRAIIEKLTSGTNLTSYIGENKIKEDQFQDTEFNFPAVRVIIQDQTPQGDANCKTHLSDLLFSVAIFSEKPSSYECSRIKGLVRDELFGAQIYGRDENNNPKFTLIRIDLLTSSAPSRLDDRVWRSELFFSSVIGES